MLDSINHMALKSHFLCENFNILPSIFCHHLHYVIMNVITLHYLSITTSGLSILLHGIISLLEAMSCDKFCYNMDMI